MRMYGIASSWRPSLEMLYVNMRCANEDNRPAWTLGARRLIKTLSTCISKKQDMTRKNNTSFQNSS